MNLTNGERVAKLSRDLIRRPGNIGRYLAHNVIAPRPPIELELPWFAYTAIDFLEKFLQPHMRVFEFGSGGSTLFFAKRVRGVVSVEDDLHWHDMMANKLTRDGLTNVDLRFCPVQFSNAEEFAESRYVRAVRERTFDVIIVDGSESNLEMRPICFRAAEEQIAPGGIIIVDDSWRYQTLRQSCRAQKSETFESVGPARFGVTSTDVYFY